MSETRYGGVAMRGGRLLAVAAVLVLGLAGCSQEQPASETLPTTAVTTEATPTLEALGPPDLPMPAEAREQTPAGAEAFIRYYMDVYNLAQEQLDATYLRALSQGCSTCERLSADIDADGQAGYTYDGGTVNITGVGTPGVNEGEAQAAFSIIQEPLVILDSAGAPVDGLSFPQRDSPSCGAILNWSSSVDSWMFTQWDVA